MAKNNSSAKNVMTVLLEKLEKMQIDVEPDFDKMDGTNFREWLCQTETWIGANGFEKILDLTAEDITEEMMPDIRMFGARIILMIQPHIARTITSRIPSEIFKELKDRYWNQSIYTVRKIYEKLTKLKMKSTDFQSHLNEFEKIYYDLTIAGSPLHEEIQISILIDSIPEQYHDIKKDINMMMDIFPKTSLARVKQYLLMEFNELTEQMKSNDDFGSFNKQTNQGRRRQQSKKIKCFNCGGEGHFAKICTKPRRRMTERFGREI